MNSLFILSRSLPAVSEENVTTSSQKFELRLAKGLSQLFDHITVVSPNVQKEQSLDGIRYLPAPLLNRRLADYYVTCKEEKFSHILCFGYDPMILRQILRFGPEVKKFAFVFDTHLGMTAHRNPIRFHLLDMYFRVGIRYLNRLDGILLFQKAAYEDMRLKIPYLITTVTSDSQMHTLPVIPSADGTFRVLYAGAFTAYNCISEIVAAADRFWREKAAVTFTLCGDGPLFAKTEAEHPQNVSVLKKRSNREVIELMRSADLVLNVRRKTDRVNLYSYPSKLIECLESKKTVLTTAGFQPEPLEDVAFILENTDPDSIYEGILDVMRNKKACQEKILRTEPYLETYHNKDKEMASIFNFMISGRKT